MTVIPLDTIANPKHRTFIKYVSDIFDENRGKINDHLALTKFNSTNHTILLNTESPELNGKTLIPFDSDKLLFAPIKINNIVSDNPQNNNSINVLIQPPSAKNHIWEAVSNADTIVIFMTFDKTPIAGFSIRFADAVRTKYRTSIEIANDNREIIGSASDMDSSWETNTHQFYQFSTPIEGATKAKMTINLVGANQDFEWKIGNISLYSSMNGESLKNLNDSGMIVWSQIASPTIKREMDAAPESGTVSQPSTTIAAQEPLEEIANQTDFAGTPLIYTPNRDRQFFDNISEEEITRISNLPRLYTTTDLPTGDKIYTFQTKEIDRALILKFSPQIEMNKYPDEAQTDLDKLLDTGYIKKGGFKNYILTFYIKLENITRTNEVLLWKYGGFFFSKNQPQMARAVNLTIPISNNTGGADTPHVYSEYFFEQLVDMTDNLMVNADLQFNGIEPSKWIGLQFIRNVDTENKKAVQIVRINRNPMDERGRLVNPNGFENYLVFNDEGSDDHIPHVWSGVVEAISIIGAEFVSLYGISLYEFKKE